MPLALAYFMHIKRHGCTRRPKSDYARLFPTFGGTVTNGYVIGSPEAVRLLPAYYRGSSATAPRPHLKARICAHFVPLFDHRTHSNLEIEHENGRMLNFRRAMFFNGHERKARRLDGKLKLYRRQRGGSCNSQQPRHTSCSILVGCHDVARSPH